MKVLYSAFEAVPFIKQGGLGDVAGTLPASIKSNNCEIRVIIPYLDTIADEITMRLKHVGDSSVESAGETREFSLYSIKMKGVYYYLIKNKHYFDRGAVYGEKDDLERFVFFCRATLQSISLMKGFVPDIIHCND